MSFESPQSSVESLEHKKLRVKNEIQIALMRRECSPDDGEAGLENWIIDNSVPFREAFDLVMESNPALLDEWDTDRERYVEMFMEGLEAAREEKKRKAA